MQSDENQNTASERRAFGNLYQRVKEQVYRVIFPDQLRLTLYNKVMIGVIVLNSVVFILETEPALYGRFKTQFDVFNLIIVLFFSLDYVLNLWCCNCDARYSGHVVGRLKYMITGYALVDLLAIFPFHFFMHAQFLQNTTVVRIARLVKLARYIKSFKLIAKVVRAKRDLLLSTLSIIAFLLVITSTLVYYTENPGQPDKFSSILATMYWGIITFTSTGYGDVVPLTGLGKFLAGVMSTLGMLLFALPASILASGFIEHFFKELQKKQDAGGSKKSRL